MAKIEDLRAEYKEVGSNLRFLNASRLGLVTLMTTIITLIVGAWWNVVGPRAITASSPAADGVIFCFARIGLPILGLVVILVIYFTERRTLRLYDGVLERAIELEDLLENKEGIYHRIQEKIVYFPGTKVELTLRRIMGLVYLLASFFLLIILLVSIT